MSACNILVVDDEESVCRSVRKVLTKRGHKVDEALSAASALELIESKRYDLLLLDVKMPKVGGFDLLEEVKRLRPETTTLMITGYPCIKSAVKSIRMGAHDYIAKPFTSEELTGFVEKALRGKPGGQTGSDSEEMEKVEEAEEVGKAVLDVIDVDMPFDSQEVEEYTSRQYVDSLTRSDVTIAARPESTLAICPMGQMACKKYTKTGEDCGEACPILERAKKLAARSSLLSQTKDPIDVDMPFPMDEVEQQTCAEYVMALSRGQPVAGHWGEAEAEVARQCRLLPRVLVVDDEVTVCMSVRKILSKGGKGEVDEANNPKEALQKIKTEDYGVILLDLKLGPDDGLDLLEKIKKIRPEQKVIIITGYASVESAVKATKLGAKDYLPKPFTSGELREAVELAMAA